MLAVRVWGANVRFQPPAAKCSMSDEGTETFIAVGGAEAVRAPAGPSEQSTRIRAAADESAAVRRDGMQECSDRSPHTNRVQLINVSAYRRL